MVDGGQEPLGGQSWKPPMQSNQITSHSLFTLYNSCFIMFSFFLNFSQFYEIANEGLNWPNINNKIQANFLNYF